MKTRSTLLGYLLIGPSVLLLIVLLFIPLLYSLQISFQDTDLSRGAPTWIGISGYIDSFKDGEPEDRQTIGRLDGRGRFLPSGDRPRGGVVA